MCSSHSKGTHEEASSAPGRVGTSTPRTRVQGAVERSLQLLQAKVKNLNKAGWNGLVSRAAET